MSTVLTSFQLNFLIIFKSADRAAALHHIIINICLQTASTGKMYK